MSAGREHVAQAPVPPTALVIFGATGDLTARKLVPALSALAGHGELGLSVAIVGVGRTELTDEAFAELLRVADGGRRLAHRMRGRIRYVAGDYDDADTYVRLRKALIGLDERHGTSGSRVFYLATPPSTFVPIVAGLGEEGLNVPDRENAFARVVIEKPFGHDTETAAALDHEVHRFFDEPQIYRIDHYLGKETVQNVLALRFANAIFEPVWNRRYIDSVQITVAEELGVGHRGGFYEQAGALRDIVQNHVLQVLALTAMEPPAVMDASGIRDEKVKLLRAVEIMRPEQVATDVVRARYDRGVVGGVEVPGYREESDVDPRSQTETFVAMKLTVDNWRWAGVPFFIRTGKRLPRRVTEVVLSFRPVPHLPFSEQNSRLLGANALVLRIQPDEGISLCFGAKAPGPSFDLRSVAMDFRYRGAFAAEPPDAYERLLHDALVGDATLFIRNDEVEQAWRIVAPIQQAWADESVILARYAAGSWGPNEAAELLERDGRRWRAA